MDTERITSSKRLQPSVPLLIESTSGKVRRTNNYVKDIKSLAKLYTVVDINTPFERAKPVNKQSARQMQSAKPSQRRKRNHFFRVAS
jgi:hypothetical protein